MRIFFSPCAIIILNNLREKYHSIMPLLRVNNKPITMTGKEDERVSFHYDDQTLPLNRNRNNAGNKQKKQNKNQQQQNQQNQNNSSCSDNKCGC